MQDRPTYDELLAAIERFLDEEIVPNVPGSRGFHGRVAANAIRTIRRELASEEEHLRTEWTGLDKVLGPVPLPDTLADLREILRERNEELCQEIQSGDLSLERLEATMHHVRRTLEDKLRVTNPGLLERG
jgi:hypothetical protein